ncbi:hypothetical protein C5Y96_05760 [Blastopirellula marina]|uniref:Uncharacterized protein n=1 Tax=Blastopirellula marina TaxID=124 RepID=A0A2S8G4Y4_9BACT|nr:MULTISPECIES: hypothetical protein [Pirellulaceae]PQO39360.1 hypothetical protein C5Y96_05760 [Blastopirellula marina]RCS55668.1 hypothetical protein DTL36_05770 [Bremerella cremea]
MTSATKAAPTGPARTKSDPQAVLYAVLEKHGKSNGNRENLVAGSTAVSLVVSGKIGRKTVHEEIKGNLVIGADGTMADNQKPDTVELTALLLSQLGKKKRAEFIAELSEAKKLPKVDDADKEAAEGLVKALTVKGSKPKNGAVQIEANSNS